MGKKRASYYKQIWITQFLTGRAASERQVVRRALAVLEALTRGQSPHGASFRNAAEMQAVALRAAASFDRAARRKPGQHGHSKASTPARRRKRPSP